MDMDGLSRSIAMALSGWCALPAACVFAGPGRSSTVSVRKSTLYPLETALSTAPYALPLEVGQAVAAWVGLRPPQIAALQVAEGMWLSLFGANCTESYCGKSSSFNTRRQNLLRQ